MLSNPNQYIHYLKLQLAELNHNAYTCLAAEDPELIQALKLTPHNFNQNTAIAKGNWAAVTPAGKHFVARVATSHQEIVFKSQKNGNTHTLQPQVLWEESRNALAKRSKADAFRRRKLTQLLRTKALSPFFLALPLKQGETTLFRKAKGDLATYLKTAPALSKIEKYRFILTLLHAVLALHKHGLTHLDIRPPNILLYQTPDGTLSCKLADLDGIKATDKVGTLQDTSHIIFTAATANMEQVVATTPFSPGCHITRKKAEISSLPYGCYHMTSNQVVYYPNHHPNGVKLPAEAAEHLRQRAKELNTSFLPKSEIESILGRVETSSNYKPETYKAINAYAMDLTALSCTLKYIVASSPQTCSNSEASQKLKNKLWENLMPNLDEYTCSFPADSDLSPQDAQAKSIAKLEATIDSVVVQLKKEFPDEGFFSDTSTGWEGVLPELFNNPKDKSISNLQTTIQSVVVQLKKEFPGEAGKEARNAAWCFYPAAEGEFADDYTEQDTISAESENLFYFLAEAEREEAAYLETQLSILTALAEVENDPTKTTLFGVEINPENRAESIETIKTHLKQNPILKDIDICHKIQEKGFAQLGEPEQILFLERCFKRPDFLLRRLVASALPTDLNKLLAFLTMIFKEALKREQQNPNSGAMAHALSLYAVPVVGKHLQNHFYELESRIFPDSSSASSRTRAELLASFRAAFMMREAYDDIQATAQRLPCGHKKTLCIQAAAKLQKIIYNSTPLAPSANCSETAANVTTEILKHRVCAFNATIDNTIPELEKHRPSLKMALAYLLKPLSALCHKRFFAPKSLKTAKKLRDTQSSLPFHECLPREARSGPEPETKLP